MNYQYNKFSNTLRDLQDCLQTIDEGEETSPEEVKAARKLLETAAQFLQDLGIVENVNYPALEVIIRESLGRE